MLMFVLNPLRHIGNNNNIDYFFKNESLRE